MIIDAEADIRDLDVGDVNDETTDLPPSVLAEIMNLKKSRELLADEKDGQELPHDIEGGCAVEQGKEQDNFSAAAGTPSANLILEQRLSEIEA